MTTATCITTKLPYIRYGLRALFALLTLAAVGSGYLTQWSHQRHALLSSGAIVPLRVVDLRPDYITMFRQAMWLLGEEPVTALSISSSSVSREEVRWAFPEANIFPQPQLGLVPLALKSPDS